MFINLCTAPIIAVTFDLGRVTTAADVIANKEVFIAVTFDLGRVTTLDTLCVHRIISIAVTFDLGRVTTSLKFAYVNGWLLR